MVIITPAEFKAAFIKVVESQEFKHNLFTEWKSGDKKFTDIMLGEKGGGGEKVGVIAKTAVEINPLLKCYDEYFKIDSIYYWNKKLQEKDKKATWADYIAAAIEVENVYWKSYEECSKLSIINSPLRVLITYPDEKNKEGLLDEYSYILGRADVFGDFADRRRFLAVFGEQKGSGVEWTFHVFNGNGFDEL